MLTRLFSNRQANLRGPLLMLAAAVTFAAFNLLVKLMQSAFRVWDIAFYRFSFGALVTLILILSQRVSFKGCGTGLLLLRGILGTLAFLVLLVALRSIPLSTAMVFFYSFPAFAALFSPLLFKERITIAEVLCVLVAFSGIGILFDFRFGGTLTGQATALLAGSLAGLAVAVIHKLREKNGSVIIYFYFCVTGLCMAGPFFGAAPRIPQNKQEMLMVLGSMCLITIAQLLMTQAFRYCKSWEGGVLLTFEVIFTAFFGIVFLYEALTWKLLLGGLLVIAGAFGLSVINAHRKAAPPPPSLQDG
ncbi:MAG: DMT family transporter [Desulfobacterales bacterium]|nr:MAG: DMT family transporter [Desulfobacterales bacterium]